jgi:hypothetical protein
MALTIQDPLLAYDANQAGACVDEMKESVQGCQALDYSPCLAAFSGDRAPGATCSQALDCAPGPWGQAVCTQDGHCLQPARGVLNQPCGYSCIDSRTGMTCEGIYQAGDALNQVGCHSWDGLFCSVNAGGTCQPRATDCRSMPDVPCPGGGTCDLATGTCMPPVPMGAPCPTMDECGDNAYCGDGVCQPLKPLHSLCAVNEECDTHRCIKGICSPFSKVAAALCYDPAPRM